MQSTVISASNSGEKKKRHDSGLPGTYSLLGGKDNKEIHKQIVYVL